MRLEELMACDQLPLRPDHTIRDAAQRMDEGRCTALPVCDGERLVGVLTDRDVTRAVAGRPNPGAVAVEEVMTRDVAAASPDATLLEASELMSERRLEHLCVSKQGRYLGMVHVEVRWNDVGPGLPIPTANFCGHPEL